MDTGGGEAVLGLLRIDGVDVALPLAALREVVPCPERFSGLPAAAEGLLGAMRLRTLVLPVLDLRPVLGRPAERRRDQVVVVVADAGSVLGLLVDEVCGVLRVPTEGLAPVAAHRGELLFSHAFLHPDTGAPVSVLDAAVVLGRPGLPVVADRTRAVAAVDGGNGDRGAGRATRRLVTVRCGGHALAFDIAQVHTTLPALDPRPSVLSGSLCRGVVDYAGAEVPVADPLALLGLGRMTGDGFGAGLVLDLGHGYVVLGTTELLDLVEVAATDVLPFPALGTPRPDLLTGTAQLADGSAVLVIHGPTLVAEEALVGLASVNTALPDATSAVPAPRQAAAGEAVEDVGRPYLIATAGLDLATRLDQVAEILPFPAELLGTATDDGVLGVVVHRSAAVPVLCLSTVLGRGPSTRPGTACLLLVASGDGYVGFGVDALRSIEPLTWRDPDAARPVPDGDPARLLRAAPLLQVGTESRLLPDIDLVDLAERILARGGTPPVPVPGEPALAGA